MTALNIFVRDQSAYMLSDGLAYSGEGVVLCIQDKIATDARLRLAIAVTNRSVEGLEDLINAWFAMQTDQRCALASIDGLLRQLHDETHAPDLDGDGHPEGVRLGVVGYDIAQARPFGFMVNSVDHMLGESYAAFERINLRTMFSPPVRPDPWPGHSFDPKRHTTALAKRQRLAPDSRGIYRVGGRFEMVEVNASGVRRSFVCEWPDEIGKPIDLNLKLRRVRPQAEALSAADGSAMPALHGSAAIMSQHPHPVAHHG